MKKMVLALVVFLLAKISFAAPLSAVEISARTKPFVERVEKIKEKEFTGKEKESLKNVEIKKVLTRAMTLIVEKAGAGNVDALIKLATLGNTADVLNKIGELSSIIGEIKSGVELTAEQQQAQDGLRMLSLSATGLEVIMKDPAEAKNSAEAQKIEQENKETLAKIEADITLSLNISPRIASFKKYKNSPKAKQYVDAFEGALRTGKTARQAFEEASKVKNIGEKEILDCQI